MAATDSPTLPRLTAAPEQPLSLETAAAKRSSCAAAQSAVLPRREWPTTKVRVLSISGSVCR